VANLRVYAILFALVVATALVACSSGAQLIIVNNSDVPLVDVVASGSGFSTQLGSVPPHGPRQATVYPRGESDLRLTFTANGKPITFGPDGYFEASGGYRVTANVSSDFQVSVKSEIR
jgi:hypothetical protein